MIDLEYKNVNEIIIHCTATVPNTVTPQRIKEYHQYLGWEDCGYHYIIDENGKEHKMRPTKYVGAHCYGHNHCSIGIAYMGGISDAIEQTPKDTMTPKQRYTLFMRVITEMVRYNIPLDGVHCHNEFANKACPSFSRKNMIRKLYRTLVEARTQGYDYKITNEIEQYMKENDNQYRTNINFKTKENGN